MERGHFNVTFWNKKRIKLNFQQQRVLHYEMYDVSEKNHRAIELKSNFFLHFRALRRRHNTSISI